MNDSRMKIITDYLCGFLPEAQLKQYVLPDCPEIKLWLLDDAFDDEALSQSQVEVLSDDPPYWIFCWASGHALASQIINGNVDVAGKTVLDFGSGSGVVAIAAAKAGAKKVIACEIDPIAQQMIELNCELNQVEICITNNLEESESTDIVLAADVLYEAKNLVWLDDFLLKANDVVVADSRLKNLNHPAYRFKNTITTTSFPEYHEAKANNEVKFYFAGLEPK